MTPLRIHIERAGPDLALALRSALSRSRTALAEKPTFAQADAEPGAEATIARTRAFAADIPPGTEALIITILTAPSPGLDHLSHHTVNAALWAFTQQAALEWAPRRIRVNAIGLRTSPALPFAPQEQSGLAAGPAPATPASIEDIARTICAIAAWPSMTGQIVRLGGK